ncbi:MAG: hypothetical protein GYB66_06615 [Chloroflexi bacterium]|nr:hypothetical protein [Chloroflexota bacterium]
MAQQHLVEGYHFLYFAPNLSAAWFFQASRRYWEHYRPIVLYNLEIVEYVPTTDRLTITSVARSDTATLVKEDITQRFPNAFHDALVYDYLEDLALTLDVRVELGQPLGVPIE